MSGARQHSIVRHRQNYYYVPLEDDYLVMYEELAKQLAPAKLQQLEEKQASLGKERTVKKPLSAPSDCKAMIASVLEGWMNSKRPSAKSENDLYAYFTYEEWEQQLRYRYSRSIIIQSLKEMEEEGQYTDKEGKTSRGTIKKRRFVQNTFEYQLNLPVVHALLDALPEISPFEQQSRPVLGRPRKNRVKINGLNVDGISQDTRKNRLHLDDGSVEIDGGSVYVDDGRLKTDVSTITQITTQNSSQITTQKDSDSESRNPREEQAEPFAAPVVAADVPVSSHPSFSDVAVLIKQMDLPEAQKQTILQAIDTDGVSADEDAEPLDSVTAINHTAPLRTGERIGQGAHAHESVAGGMRVPPAYRDLLGASQEQNRVPIEWHASSSLPVQARAVPCIRTPEGTRQADAHDNTTRETVRMDEQAGRQEIPHPLAEGVRGTPPEQSEASPSTTRQRRVKPDLGPLVMPPEDVPWCAETIVQIFEVRQGRRYPNGAKRKSERERDIQLEFSDTLAKMEDLDRATIIRAAEHLETRKQGWWKENVGRVTPRHLVEKDRVHTMLDELARLDQKAQFRVVSSSHSPGAPRKLVGVTDEWLRKNPKIGV